MASRPRATPAHKHNIRLERVKKILALVPPRGASSSDSSISDDDKEIVKDDTLYSSEPPSLDSSLERLDILEDSHDDTLLSEDLVPSTPSISEVLASHNLPQDLPAIQSVSSVLSVPSTPEAPNLPKNSHSKKGRNTLPTLLTKKKKAFVRKPLDFEWESGKFKYAAILEEITFVKFGSESKSPSEYFFDFFDENVMKIIIENTNLYAVQKFLKNINLSRDELLDFIAINLLMGIVKMPSYRDYWNKELRYNLIADVMSLKRYEQIRQFLHFVDNTQQDDDRYFKVRPIFEAVRRNCLEIEEEHRYSVDEMMVPYKGTRAGNRRQYMAKKPKKWGFKIFVRAGVSGCVYDFIAYAGDDTFRNHSFTEYEDSLGVGAKVVIALCQSIQHKPAVVYFDNFFSSLELIHLLRQEYGVFSLGTIRANRLRGCQEKLPSDKELLKKGRGSSKQVVCNKNKISVVKWHDNKSVILASTYVDSFPMEKIKRFSKDAKSKVDIPCPQIVKHYNSHMGGVDLCDMLISLYRTNYKTKRWYMALFSQLLDICVNNAWIMYRKDCAHYNKSPVKLKIFRIRICYELLSKNRVAATTSSSFQQEKVKKIQKPTAPRPTDAIRRDNVGHMPDFITAPGRCKFCKNGMTNVICSKCNLRLCFVKKRNCFKKFHEQ